MTEPVSLPAPAATLDYRASQQSHHQKILAQLLAHQAGSVSQPSAMFSAIDSIGQVSASPDLYSLDSNSTSAGLQMPSDGHRASTSSSASTRSSPYLKSPLQDSFAQSQTGATLPQNWDNLGWGEMTFGMVAQAQSNLAMSLSCANAAFGADKHLPATSWLASQQSIDPGKLHQAPSTTSSFNQDATIFNQYPHTSQIFAPIAGPPMYQTLAASPLRSVSPGSDMEESTSGAGSEAEIDSSSKASRAATSGQNDGTTRRSKRLRKRADSDFSLDSSDVSKRATRRLTWSSNNDARQRELEVEVHKRELERLREMKKFEQDNGKGNRKERRRLQNRLAQRAFRARSKIHGKEFEEHLGDLESMSANQAERIEQLHQIVERLQKENASLKAGRWAAFQGNQASAPVMGNPGDGAEATRNEKAW